MPVIKINKCLNCGISHEWLFVGASLRELRMIKKLTGMTATQFASAGDDGDPEALAALLYVLHKRDKITVPFDDIDLEFDDFEMEPTKEEKQEMTELEERAKAETDRNQGPKLRNGQTKKAD